MKGNLYPTVKQQIINKKNIVRLFIIITFY